jgi:hypothetical protein
MPFPVTKTWLGMATESTRGTPVTPTFWSPIRAPDFQPMVKYVEDNNWRGSPVEPYNLLPGIEWGELNYEADAFCDAIGWPLSSLLADVTTTGSADPYTSTFSLLTTGDTQPPGRTLSLFNGFNMREMPASQCSELSLKFQADGLLSYAAKWVGYFPTVATTATDTFSTVVPQVGWNCTAKINTVATVKLWSAEITIARPTPVIHTAQGSQNPYRIFGGNLKVSGKATFVYEDDTEFGYYSAGTTLALDLLFAVQGLSSTRSIDIHMNTVKLINPTKPVFGKEYVETEATFTAMANTTDVGTSGGYSPIKVTTVSPQATY